MQYTIELFELWWACLTAAMKDRSLAFPISLLIGASLGGLFWWLGSLSAKLWHKRFHMKVSLHILCAMAALLSILVALTFTSSHYMEDAVKISLNQWKQQTLNDDEWKHDAFCDAWDAVAKGGQEVDVRVEPSPRTDRSLTKLSMVHPESKKAVVRVYVSSAMEAFKRNRPYLYGIINPDAEIPQERLDASMLGWFREHPGEPFPVEQGVDVMTTMLEYSGKQQVESVAQYTRRLCFALFIISQIVVFLAIAFFAQRANRPAVEI